MATRVLRSNSTVKSLTRLTESPTSKRIRSKNDDKIPQSKQRKISHPKSVKSDRKTTSKIDIKVKKEKNDESPVKSKNSKKIKSPPKIIKPEVDLLSVKIEKPVNLGNKFIGAHTSIQGQLANAVLDATKMGAKAFGLFLRSQRQWNCKPLDDQVAENFKKACVENGFSPHLILPHGSYLLNCGSPKGEILEKSRNALIDELQRCEKLGLTLFNFHPGSTCGEISIDESISKIAESINIAHSKTKYVTTVIENMSRQGHTIGGDFKELRSIIDQVHDKSRVGVCLDTCHAFAAGYDLATEDGFKSMMDDFENIIGFEYLKGIHFNDSKGEVGCHLDRHENIGMGHIGLKGFKRFMNDDRLNNLPIILETPWISDDVNAKEISLLYSLIEN